MLGVVTASLLREKPKRNNDEEVLQKQVVQFLRWALPADAVYFAIPNGGLRSKRVASRLVGQGVRAGVSDLCIIWRGHPLFIELKTPVGTLSAVQKQMHQKLRLCGATVLVARSIEGIECALLEMGIPLRATTSGSRPMRVGGASQQGLGV